MANTYSPQSLGITAPSGGFQQGGWYSGRQYWGGTLSDPGSIHPSSNQVGAGQVVSAEVNALSAAAQGVSSQQFNQYLQGQQQKSANVTPTANVTPNQNYGQPMATGQTGTTGVGTGSLGSTTPQAALNLPDLYSMTVISFSRMLLLKTE